MKKIVYFITAFTMLYGVDSEARLPKSQGQMAAALLMQKAGLDINIPTGWTNETHRTKVDGLMDEQNGNKTYQFIIKTIYTTDGRNAFARWMKKAYQNCTYIKEGGGREWKNCKQERESYRDAYINLCNLLKGFEDMYPTSIRGTFNPGPQQQIIQLANAFFPCWTGTFTAFFISANSKNCWSLNRANSSNTAAAKVIGVSGAPSLWVLSADNNTEEAKRYNAILSQCNNLVKKILWVMFVLETVDDPKVVETIVSDDITGKKISDITASDDRFDVVPVPNTFYLDNKQNPHGTCIISTVLNLLNISGRLDEKSDAKIPFTNRPSKEKVPGLTTIKEFIDDNQSTFIDAVNTTNFQTFVNILKKFITDHGGLQQDHDKDIIAKALCLDNKNVHISTNKPTEAQWNDGKTIRLTNINGKDVTIRFGLSSALNPNSYHMEIVDIKQTEK